MEAKSLEVRLTQLENEVRALRKQLTMKVLGNDPSTNYGLAAQAIAVGSVLAGSFSLQLNGVLTTMNNVVNPTTGDTESITSQDVSVANGDNSFMSPDAFAVLAWDPSIPGYKVIAFMADDGSGSGNLTLSAIGSGKQIILNNAAPAISITDGIHTSLMGPTAFEVANLPGASGALAITPASIQYKDWAGVNQTANFVITPNLFTGGLRTT